VSWVALGWGEPLVPWWGRPGFVGQPHWAGWGGPRVVYNVVVNRTTVVNVNTINVYRNVTVQNAVVGVPQERFGRVPVHEARVAHVDVRQLEPVRGTLRVTPAPSSFVASSGAAIRPPETVVSRSVIATRPLAPRAVALAPRAGGVKQAPVVNVPQARIVNVPRAVTTAPARPAFGASSVERARPAPPPGFMTSLPSAAREPVRSEPPSREQTRVAPREQMGQPSQASSAPRAEPRAEQARRALPGEPANRLAPGRGEGMRPEAGRGGEPPPAMRRSGPPEGERR
jgi:hypothetical protein